MRCNDPRFPGGKVTVIGNDNQRAVSYIWQLVQIACVTQFVAWEASPCRRRPTFDVISKCVGVVYVVVSNGSCRSESYMTFGVSEKGRNRSWFESLFGENEPR